MMVASNYDGEIDRAGKKKTLMFNVVNIFSPFSLVGLSEIIAVRLGLSKCLTFGMMLYNISLNYRIGIIIHLLHI